MRKIKNKKFYEVNKKIKQLTHPHVRKKKIKNFTK